MLPIGLQLYTVRNEMEQDFEGTLKKVAEMGYEGVEFAGLFGKSAGEVKALLEKYNLTPVSAHVPFADMKADIDAVIATYKEIGCPYIAVPYLDEEYRPGKPAFAETLAEIARIGKICRENGLTLLYHNHDFEFVKLDGKYGLDVMYDTVPAEDLQTELDVCWVNVGGEDPAPYVLKYSGRAPVVHLKDFVMKGREKPKKLYELIGIETEGEEAGEEDFSFKPVGYGVQDMPAIVAAAEKAGAKWLIVEQDRPDTGNTELSAAEKSVRYLQSLA
ncbi:MAG: sugar phosphate isomerase/epimerase [Clostridia bacterium]|nr:sugar phosphate isomerase/epimerase [Clostridia bacterium]